MKSILAILLAVVAISYAQLAPPVILDNATMLTLGQQYAGSLLPQASTTWYGIPNLFYVYLPINTRNITITFNQPTGNTGDCSDFYIYSSAEGFPCPSQAPFSYSYPEFLCYEANYQVYEDGPFSATYYAGYYTGDQGSIGLQVVSGGYLYFSLSRYYSSDSAKTCPFTFEVDATYCPSGQIAVGDSYEDDQNCVAYTNVTTNNSSSFTASFSKIGYGNGGDDAVYRVVLPDMTGSVSITVRANDTFYVYGQNREVIRNDEYSGCYTYGSSNDDSSYTGMVTCAGVQPGNYYIYIYSSSDLTGNITISTLTCTGNQVGPYCNSTYINVTQAIMSGSTTFTVTEDAGAYGCGQLPALSNNIINFYPTGNTSYPDFYYGRGGFPTSGYEYISFYTYPYYSVAFSYLDELGPYDSNNICFYASPCSSGVCVMTLYTNQTAIYAGLTSTSSGSNTGVSGTVTGNTGNTGMTGTVTGNTGMTGSTNMTTGRMTTGMMNTSMTTGMMNTNMTTGMHTNMTTGMNATSTSSSPAATSSTSSAMFMIPSLLVALAALMF